MNIEKIREALKQARKVGVEMEWDGMKDRCEQAIAELDKAQQPGKALTDEVTIMIAELTSTDVATQAAVVGAIRHVRDNGYLSPAAGLTVDEVMECAWDTGYIYTDEMADELRGRLTAAMEAKR